MTSDHKLFRVRTLDSRNKVWMAFKYQVVCYLPYFFEMREWCWEQWGPGMEHEFWLNMMPFQKHPYPWLWDCSKFQGASINNGKIYLRDDESLTLFVLRWS